MAKKIHVRLARPEGIFFDQSQDGNPKVIPGKIVQLHKTPRVQKWISAGGLVEVDPNSDEYKDWEKEEVRKGQIDDENEQAHLAKKSQAAIKQFGPLAAALAQSLKNANAETKQPAGKQPAGKQPAGKQPAGKQPAKVSDEDEKGKTGDENE